MCKLLFFPQFDFLSDGKLKPKLKPFFKLKLKLDFISIEWCPRLCGKCDKSTETITKNLILPLHLG